MYFCTVCVVFSHARIAFPKFVEVKHTIYFERPYLNFGGIAVEGSLFLGIEGPHSVGTDWGL